jgi:hypothetical protein
MVVVLAVIIVAPCIVATGFKLNTRRLIRRQARRTQLTS